MPNRDGTGPFGDGRPGRGCGPCGRFGCQPRRGNGRGPGRAFGYRFRGGWEVREELPPQGNDSGFYPYDQAGLKTRKEELEEQLNWIRGQLETKKDNLD